MLVLDPLHLAMIVLLIDAGIEFAFVSTMVSWLHRRAGGSFTINNGGHQFTLHGKPLNLLVNQGHTSNGAAGTAIVLICIFGSLVLYMRSRAAFWGKGIVKVLYHLWLVLTVLSALLSLTALIYTNVLTNKYAGQKINLQIASQLNNRPYPNQVPYPLDSWTPQNWFSALLNTPLASQDDVSDIRRHLKIMYGWRWNLIPLFLIGVIVAVLAFKDAFKRRREMQERVRKVGYEAAEENRMISR